MIIDTTYNSKPQHRLTSGCIFLVFSSVCFIWGRLSFLIFGQKKIFITPTLFWKVALAHAFLFPKYYPDVYSTKQGTQVNDCPCQLLMMIWDPSGPWGKHSVLTWDDFSSPASARSSFALWWMSLWVSILWSSDRPSTLWINTSRGLMSVLTL